jgi:hypothetical protein
MSLKTRLVEDALRGVGDGAQSGCQRFLVFEGSYEK